VPVSSGTAIPTAPGSTRSSSGRPCLGGAFLRRKGSLPSGPPT